MRVQRTIVCPATRNRHIPISVIRRIILIHVRRPRVVSITNLRPVYFKSVISCSLRNQVAIFVFTRPISSGITMAAMSAILVAICRRTIIVNVSLRVTMLRVIIIVSPLRQGTINHRHARSVQVAIAIRICVNELVPYKDE